MITLIASTISFAPALLVAQPAISVPGGAGKYDFTNIDAENRFFIACHPGKSSLTIVDLKSGALKEVDAGAACNGAAADSARHKVFAAGPGNTLVCFDSKTWKKVGSLPLGGPGDCVQTDTKRGVVYVDNDDGTNLWVVDSSTLKLVGSVTIKEAPEYMEFDAAKDRIYQAIKSTSTVQVINPGTQKVLSEWSLGALKSPHGLCLDRKTQTLMVVGSNGKLAILNAPTGKLTASVDVLDKSDQVAYDAGLQRLYIPAKGQIQIVSIKGGQGSILGTVAVDSDCKRATVDPKTHDVWVAYSNSKGSFVQKFKAN